MVLKKNFIANAVVSFFDDLTLIESRSWLDFVNPGWLLELLKLVVNVVRDD